MPVAAEPGLTRLAPDRAVSLWFRDLVTDHPWLVEAGHVGAFALHPWVFRVLVAAACVVAWRAGRRRAAAVTGATMAGGGLLGVVLKLVIARPRPAWGDPVATEVGFSMPSGHALNAALGVGLLLLLAWPWLRRHGWTAPAVAVGIVVVAVTALDRLVLGVHYLSDVSVGVALGGLLAGAALRLTCRTARPGAPGRERTRR